jgi:Fe2+ or Zn2+ uptake regulation protein
MSHQARAVRIDISNSLARRGVRVTGARRAVLDVLAGSPLPLTVSQIHERVAAKRASIVSIYRTVNLLAGIGLLRTTDSVRGSRRYELDEQFTGHHHHLICQICGRIEDLRGCLIDDQALRRLNHRVRHQRRFRVTNHELHLFGLCQECDR